MSSSQDRLARDGGQPVRNTKEHPWPRWPVISEQEWVDKIEPALRKVYLSHVEGIGGKVTADVEQSFARFCDAKYCRMVPHGTDALMAAIIAALELESWGPSGEIIIPNYTYIATASAPLHQRMSIAMVDIDPVTFTLSPEAVERAVKPGVTRAILPVHMAGHAADMDALNGIARKYGLKVIEDAAQAHGARYKGKSVGALGDAGAFSFQSSKNLSIGEGGAVVTNSQQVDEYVAAIMNSGRAPGGARWEYPRLGYNFRPSQYLAAMLNVRLHLLEEQTAHRNAMAAYLSQGLAQIPGIRPPTAANGCTRHGYHLYAMLIDPAKFGGHGRDEIAAAVQAEGVGCYVGYTKPLSTSLSLVHLANKFPQSVRVLPCPNAEYVCQHSIWILQEMLLAQQSDMQDIVAAFAKVQRAFAQG